LYIPEQPGHVDVETLRADEDRSGDIVGVSSHLRSVKSALRTAEPVVEAQDGGSEKDLDRVQEGGVVNTPARPPVVAANDLEKICLQNQIVDVLHVLGLMVDVLGALLVGESICTVLADMFSRWNCGAGA
jgi:hypothetical protein